MKIALHPDANQELQSAMQRYEEIIQGLGLRFLDELEAAFQLLAENEKVGYELEDGIRRVVLNKFPYTILYKIDKDKLYVLAIAHQSREPFYWRDRS